MGGDERGQTRRRRHQSRLQVGERLEVIDHLGGEVPRKGREDAPDRQSGIAVVLDDRPHHVRGEHHEGRGEGGDEEVVRRPGPAAAHDPPPAQHRQQAERGVGPLDEPTLRRDGGVHHHQVGGRPGPKEGLLSSASRSQSQDQRRPQRDHLPAHGVAGLGRPDPDPGVGEQHMAHPGGKRQRHPGHHDEPPRQPRDLEPLNRRRRGHDDDHHHGAYGLIGVKQKQQPPSRGRPRSRAASRQAASPSPPAPR